MVVKNGVFILIVLTLSSLIITAAAFAAIQKNWVLDLDSPVFMYEEVQFNDSNYTEQYDFNATSLDVTYGVTIPKNSTIINASLNVTGLIAPVYQLNANYDEGVLGISIGNVTEDEGNEIVTGTNDASGNVRILHGYDGSEVCKGSFFGSDDRILSTAIGNVTPNPGNEIVVGVDDAHIYVLEWTGQCNEFGIPPAWNYTVSGLEANSVAIGNLDGGSNEVLAGSGGGTVYALDNRKGNGRSSERRILLVSD